METQRKYIILVLVALVELFFIEADNQIAGESWYGPTLGLIDAPDKKVLCYSAKGGATLAAQVFFKTLSIYNLAIGYSKWIHDFEWAIFKNLPYHANSIYNIEIECGKSDWRCAKLVRNPFDRTVSSYIHAMRSDIWAEHIYYSSFNKNVTSFHAHKNSSFINFVEMLEFTKNNGIRIRFDEHYLPQSSPIDHNPIALLLTECAKSSFNDYANFSGVKYVYEPEHSDHYVKQEDVQYPNAAFVPYQELAASSKGFYTYENFYYHKEIARRVYDIFYNDFKLYEKACSQKWLIGNDCKDICSEYEIRRHQYIGI